MRETPLALLPLTAEGFIGALLVLFGILPAEGAAAPATAVFPLDVFFDVKRSIAYAPGWLWVAATLGLGVLVRGGILAATLWLADGVRGPFARAWLRALELAAVAALAFVPSAGFLFTGVATRFAPFVWIGALAGFMPAALLVRRALAISLGARRAPGGSAPPAGAFLGYAYVVAGAAAAMSVLGTIGTWAAALLVACLGPVHAVFLLGWRRQVRTGGTIEGGRVAVAATALVILGLAAATVYDRFVSTPRPARRFEARGSLLLLGGVDSTTRTGALSTVRPRMLGSTPDRTQVLSYRAGGDAYRAADTRESLDRTARIVSAQIAGARSPRTLFGHSQASLILDRILQRGLPAPERAIVVAPAPPVPPPVDLPRPGRRGPGKPGGDLARGLAWAMNLAGLRAFDVDAPASPTRLERVVVRRVGTPRLAIWAVGDSVWLDRDWRRPGERNVVVLTDHVGAATNARTFEAARAFLRGRLRHDDEGSWRAAAVSLLRYAFEAWRP